MNHESPFRTSLRVPLSATIFGNDVEVTIVDAADQTAFVVPADPDCVYDGWVDLKDLRFKGKS
jgi:hypothetical protein